MTNDGKSSTLTRTIIGLQSLPPCRVKTRLARHRIRVIEKEHLPPLSRRRQNDTHTQYDLPPTYSEDACVAAMTGSVKRLQECVRALETEKKVTAKRQSVKELLSLVEHNDNVLHHLIYTSLLQLRPLGGGRGVQQRSGNDTTFAKLVGLMVGEAEGCMLKKEHAMEVCIYVCIYYIYVCVCESEPYCVD
jgi:hypothetical protein